MEKIKKYIPKLIENNFKTEDDLRTEVIEKYSEVSNSIKFLFKKIDIKLKQHKKSFNKSGNKLNKQWGAIEELQKVYADLWDIGNFLEK
jgi:hypothetical protein